MYELTESLATVELTSGGLVLKLQAPVFECFEFNLLSSVQDGMGSANQAFAGVTLPRLS